MPIKSASLNWSLTDFESKKTVLKSAREKLKDANNENLNKGMKRI